MERLAYTSLVLPIVEYGAVCWGPFREGRIDVLDQVHKNAVEFANLTNEWNWEMVAQRSVLCTDRTMENRLGGPYVTDGLHRAFSLSRVDRDWEIGGPYVTDCTGRSV